MVFEVPTKRFARSLPASVKNTVNSVNSVNTAAAKAFSNPNEAAKISTITAASSKDVATQTQSNNKASKTTTATKTPSVNNNNSNAAQAAKAAQASQSSKSTGSSPVYSSTGSTTYFDVDSALKAVYDQARAAGINISKPSSYGKSINNSTQAQRLVDDYTAKVNQISAANASANTTFDISSQIASINSQASQYGLDFSIYPIQTKWSTQIAAQSALNEYYTAAQAKIQAQVIKQDITSAEAALTHSDREEMAKWNRENKNMYDINKTINPEYMYWLKHSASGTVAPPKYYEDALNESYQARQARQARNYEREAEVAQSQAQLKASYDATLTASGTTHASKSTVKITPQKVTAVSVPKSTTKVNDIKLIKNDTATIKKDNKAAASATKVITKDVSKAVAAGDWTKGFNSPVVSVDKAGNVTYKTAQKSFNDVKKLNLTYTMGSTKTSKGSNNTVAVIEKTNNTAELTLSNPAYKTSSPVLLVDPVAGAVALQAFKSKAADLKSFKTVAQIAKETQVAQVVNQRVAEAKKINPKASQEYLAGVAESARRSQQSPLTNMKEDASKYNAAITKVSQAIIPDLGTIVTTRDKFLRKVPVGSGKTLKDVQQKAADAVNGNIWGEAWVKTGEEELYSMRNEPVKYAAKTVAEYAAGAGLGALAGGSKVIATKTGAKAASKIANPLAKASVESIGKNVVDMTLLGSLAGGLAAEYVPYSTTASNFVNSASRGHINVTSKELDTTAAKNTIQGAKAFVIGGVGFKDGMTVGNRLADKTLQSIVSTVGKAQKIDAKYANALPSEFDVTDVARYAPKPKVKTNTEKVTELKKQVNNLKNSTKPSDKTKVKALKQQINAVQAQKKNLNALTDLKMKNSSDIKEVADNQFFDKRLVELKEMKSVAAQLAGEVKKPKVTEAAMESALRSLTPAENMRATDIKFGFKGLNRKTAPQTRSVYAKESLTGVKDLTLRAEKSGVSSVKTAAKAGISSMKKAERNVRSTGKKVVSNVKKAPTAIKNAARSTKTRVVSLTKGPSTVAPLLKKGSAKSEVAARKQRYETTHKSLKLRAEASKIESGLEKARITNNVSKEAFYTAKSAAFALNHGISTSKAAKALKFKKAETTQSLGAKRNEYSRYKSAHNKLRLKKSAEQVGPYDITDVVGHKEAVEQSPAGRAKARKEEHEEIKRFRRDALKAKQFKAQPTDVMNVVEYRRKGPQKLTTRDLADYALTQGKKYNINKNSGKTWDSVKKQAAEYNKEAASRRSKAAKKALKAKEIEILDRRDINRIDPNDFNAILTTKAQRNKSVHSKARDAVFKDRAERRKKEEAFHESPEYKAQLETHFNKWIESQKKLTTRVESERAFMKSDEFKKLEEDHFNAWIRKQKDKTSAREAQMQFKNSPEYKKLEEDHFNAFVKSQKDRTKINESERAYRQSPEYKAKEEAHFKQWERAQKDKTALRESGLHKKETPAERKKQEFHEQARQRLMQKLQKPENEIFVDLAAIAKEVERAGLKSTEGKAKATSPVNKFEASKKHTQEVFKAVSEKHNGAVGHSGSLKLLQKVKAEVKTEPKLLTRNERRVVTRAKQRVRNEAELKRLKQRQKVRQESLVKTKQRQKFKPAVKQGTKFRTWMGTYPVYATASQSDEYEKMVYPTGVTNLPSAIRSINNIEQSIKGLTRIPARTETNIRNPTRINNPIKLDTRTVPNIHTPVRPWTITPTRIDSKVLPDTRVKPDTKVIPINKIVPDMKQIEILTPILKPILNEILTVKQTYRERINVISAQESAFFPKKKKEATREVKKNNRDRLNLRRDLGNRLGNLDSMFGTSVKKTTRAAKTHKRA